MPDSSSANALSRLVAIMARLRDPVGGCEWDLAQDFSSIAPYTLEEAYEVADAIERGDMGDLKDELGDLLLQVVFHSRMAEEAGHFALADVANAISDKMERRHPHIFGDDATGGHHRWEEIKAAERAAKGDAKGPVSALDGVASALPALLRAEKLQRRAARTGFDWPDAEGARDKIVEEMAEIDAAGPEELAEEFGDLLFAVVNWARKRSVDPETALRAANAKFERRFRGMEALDANFPERSLEEQEALWQRVKGAERA